MTAQKSRRTAGQDGRNSRGRKAQEERLEGMKNYIEEIHRNTSGMSGKDKRNYILTYYWYHILGIAAAVSLILFLPVHVLFGMEKPEFTCVLVNQKIDYGRDREIGQAFADFTGKAPDRIEVDSDYYLSYGSVKLEGINESSYEKFFFRWRNQELDAVIMPESFYEYCKTLGGGYLDLGNFETGDLPLYEDGETFTAVRVEETGMKEYLLNETGERLLLVFPDNGRNQTECQEFLRFMDEL
ncbi:MAG: hypothetical protein Q4C59_00465 [Lachnospiraceae bacterium]|nr:hypothetical protein [Lachnospiraceae bacterium]